MVSLFIKASKKGSEVKPNGWHLGIFHNGCFFNWEEIVSSVWILSWHLLFPLALQYRTAPAAECCLPLILVGAAGFKYYVWEFKADVAITQYICVCLLFDSKQTVAFFLTEFLWHIDWAAFVCVCVCAPTCVSFAPIDITLAQEAKSVPPEPERVLFQAGMLCGTSQLQDLWPGYQSDP